MMAAPASWWDDTAYALRVSFYYLSIVFLLAAIWQVTAPWLVISAAVVMCGLALYALYQRRKIFSLRLTVHPDTSDISPYLGAILADLYERAGLSAAKYPLYDFRTEAVPTPPDSLKTTRNIFGMADLPTAVVMDFGKPVLAASAPLLALLSDEEEKAVLAHECVHLREGHLYWKYLLSLLAGVVSWALFGVQLVFFLAAEAMPLAVSLTLGALIACGIAALRPLVGVADDAPSSVKKSFRRHRLRRGLTIMTYASFVIMAVFETSFLAVYAATFFVQKLVLIIAFGLSRTNEYRADAGIVTLGACPLAMITSLRKLMLLEARAKGLNRLPRHGLWHGLYSTHPCSTLRIARLAEIAEKGGYLPREVSAAVNGALDVGEEHQYPAWLVKLMRKM